MITKDNYRQQQPYCEACGDYHPLINSELLTDPDRPDLWMVLCPRCEEPLYRFWKEEPNWEVLTPEAWTADHWRTLENLKLHLSQPPHHDLIISIPTMIDKITHQVFPEFFTSFDWVNWSLGIHLSTSHKKAEFAVLAFPKALALLFAFYRADRFHEHLLLERWESGMLAVLVKNLLDLSTPSLNAQ